MRINQWDKAEKIGCGEYVAKQYEKVHGVKVPWIRNILAPKKPTQRVLRLITCSRLSPEKGWDRMKQMCNMMRKANIPFTWDIFTNTKLDPNEIPEEVHIWKNRFNGIFDYLASADYLVQLSNTEGLPYSVQEALQYGTACIVTDIGGMTELIKDGVNGYVVPLDMNFDISKIKNVPQFEEYKGTDVKEWLDLLGGANYIKKERKPRMIKLRCKVPFKDMAETQNQGKDYWRKENEEFIVDNARAQQILSVVTTDNKKLVEIVETIEESKEEATEEIKEEPKKKTTRKKKVE